ncbi:HpcH/HpaI aldolase/citrate lyase family protein [Ponticoccus sp. SC2-23]|uniref:HpcH/HpaI aldolase family protein n=1 Tax=Alexandriicola marinus TaxID=2081710 RepID=UPI000FDAADA2|nr:HpcH/HpaI aldolase/citrate lyase family protein [Alexandriicola marinus]MBM1220437.1 HpcH/HpaI aldolase/citrate lyase family protein [Ponticoccus sp. SC6-9]MBM1225123.1 HpcH/HpaI aldolase/citrate lyase family protein [Ponticoccus sp. SC6-15]MBM1228637.1 HpcH/HpaI aldolase/citrate lyase family protein [Ponticoccus sp. SC6-38]MBM1233726.1 HpcH/HpaI aldolase/citrate lyase family protein [Ponticoccus sp. SC6-45]MBM1239138.1 HpcH/HpaI aldolase/citrate lyase family protein [Ponticoccus sp. SC6-49
MPAPINLFKAALRTGRCQIGLWLSLGDPSVAELASKTGFDWVVIDGEHGLNRLRDVLEQLRAVGDEAHPIVRLRDDNRAEIKQMLDIGAQTILIPMIESGEQARQAVRSTRYPPQGVRGVAPALARASGYGAIMDYIHTANDQICLIVQVETRAGIDALDDILAVDGVDGVFIGPLDLAADMGHLDRPDAPEVRAVIDTALDRIAAAGKATGLLATDPDQGPALVERGVDFLAVGIDVVTLRSALVALRGRFGPGRDGAGG